MHAIAKMIAGFSLILVLSAGTSAAYVSGGHEYSLQCNADGYQLTSKYPVTRTVGSGAATQYQSGIEKLYLGKSCDAFHKLFGTGDWCWANGGFIADFDGASFGFPRQELFCEPELFDTLNCRCE